MHISEVVMKINNISENVSMLLAQTMVIIMIKNWLTLISIVIDIINTLHSNGS
jgi:hypothetical protein